MFYYRFFFKYCLDPFDISMMFGTRVVVVRLVRIEMWSTSESIRVCVADHAVLVVDSRLYTKLPVLIYWYPLKDTPNCSIH